MKISSAVSSNVVAEKADQLKKQNEKSAEFEKNREADRKKDLAMIEARNIARQEAAKKLTEKATVEEVPSLGTTDDAYVVKVTTREPTEEEAAELKKGYSPEEIRNKARTFLESNKLSPKERDVLTEIITKQEMAERAEKKKEKA